MQEYAALVSPLWPRAAMGTLMGTCPPLSLTVPRVPSPCGFQRSSYAGASSYMYLITVYVFGEVIIERIVLCVFILLIRAFVKVEEPAYFFLLFASIRYLDVAGEVVLFVRHSISCAQLVAHSR